VEIEKKIFFSSPIVDQLSEKKFDALLESEKNNMDIIDLEKQRELQQKEYDTKELCLQQLNKKIQECINRVKDLRKNYQEEVANINIIQENLFREQEVVKQFQEENQRLTNDKNSLIQEIKNLNERVENACDDKKRLTDECSNLEKMKGAL